MIVVGLEVIVAVQVDPEWWSSGLWSGRRATRHGHGPDQTSDPGRDYYQRKRAAGKSHKEAVCCLKRRLSDVVYRTMIKDTETSLLPTG
ncbi:hypothetical protein [Micromonospora sp. NPDC048898]|uniref:hypothetical protein n=1 Tax=Micromonospora sp. NPDC048898 TaxID=3364260 RepID=UPI00372480EC